MLIFKLFFPIFGLCILVPVFGQENRLLEGTISDYSNSIINEIDNEITISNGTIIIGSKLSDLEMINEENESDILQDCGGAIFFNFEEGAWVKQEEIYSEDLRNNGQFGYQVHTNENYSIINQGFTNEPGADTRGRYYIFDHNSDAISQIESDFQDTPYSSGTNHFRGKIASGNNFFMITERYSLTQLSVYNVNFYFNVAQFYRFDGNNWVQFDTRVPSETLGFYFNPQALANEPIVIDYFGNDVDAQGSRTVVGFPYSSYFTEENVQTDRGRAYVYKYDGNSIQAGTMPLFGNNYNFLVGLPVGDVVEIGGFGHAVAVHENMVAVGAIDSETTFGANTGAVFIFRENANNDNTWHQVQTIVPGDAAAGHHFGTSVAMNEDFLAISASFNSNEYGISAGAIYLYQKNAATGLWEFFYKWMPKDLGPQYYFGYAVELSDSTIVASCPGYSSNGTDDFGAVYAFDVNRSPFITDLPEDIPCNTETITLSVQNVLRNTIDGIQFRFESSNHEVLPPENIIASAGEESGMYHLEFDPIPGAGGNITVKIIAYSGKHATIDEAFGYKFEAEINVRFTQLTELILTTPTLHLCAGQPAEFRTEFVPGMHYTFFVNDQIIEGENSHRLTLDNLTDGQQIYVIGETISTCEIYSDTLTVNVNSDIESVQLVVNDSIICSGDQVTFTAIDSYSNQPGVYYSFYVDDTLRQNGTAKSFNIDNLKNGQRVHVVRFRNEGQCITAISDELSVIVQQAEIQLNATATSICDGNEIVFTANHPNADEYRFFVDGNLVQEGTQNTYIARNLNNGQEVSVRGSNDLFCYRNEPIKVTVFSNIIVTPENTYFEDFENNDHGWVSSDDKWNGAPSSWACTSPNGTKINLAYSGSRAWVTNRGNYQTVNGVRNNTYYSGEQSSVESPCFDITALNRPVFSAQIWTSTDFQQDGVVLQYTIDNGNSWHVVGHVDGGINWYNSNVILGRPGGQTGAQQVGWTGNTDTGWRIVRVDLSDLKQLIDQTNSTVRFRFAFGSNNVVNKPDQEQFDGFAFDNVSIEERNRIVLVEHFTNVFGGRELKDQSDFIANEVRNRSLELKSLHYHMDHPDIEGIDPIYQSNTADPSARSLYYGIGALNKSVVDGFIQEEALFSNNWGLNAFRLRTLTDASLSIQINASLAEQFTVTANISKVLNTDAIDEELICHIALLELEHEFAGTPHYNVVRKMLPTAAGTKINGTWDPNTERAETIHASWLPNIDLTGYATLAVTNRRVRKKVKFGHYGKVL